MELLFTVLSNLLGSIAICLSAYAFIITKREAVYGALDQQYSELLKIGMDKPEYRNFNQTTNYLSSFSDANTLIAYETYAYLSMNWCETVIDRASKSKILADTWYPAVKIEYKLHKSWFQNPDNAHLYKQQFHKMMEEKFS